MNKLTDWAKINFEKIPEQKKKDTGFLRPENFLNELVAVGNPEKIKFGGYDAIEFDVFRRNGKVFRVRSYGKVLMNKFMNFSDENLLPMKGMFVKKTSRSGFSYIDFK